MFNNVKPIRERLEKKLTMNDVMVVKQALIIYLAIHYQELKTTKFEELPLEALLPELQELSPCW